MINLLKYFLVTLIGQVLLCSSVSKDLPCHLIWKNTGTGGRLPDDLIEIHGNKEYAARGRDFDGNYIVGSYNVEENAAEFPFENQNSTATLLASFELLTNPHGCTVSMPQFTNGQVAPEFNVKIDRWSSEEKYIGRAFVDDKWYAGTIDRGVGGINIPVDGETEFRNSYQVLTSHSPGLYLEISEFEFENEIFADGMDYMGIDKISNNGDSTITQKIDHSNKITEVTSFKTFKETTSEKTEKSGFNAIIVGKERKAEHKYRETVEEEFTTTKITEINLAYEIEIPPRTTVLACSTIGVSHNISEAYTAKGVYTALSLNTTEVQNILKETQIEGSTIVGNEVVVNIRGTFSGSMASNTQFVAVSSQDGNPEGCFVQQQRIFDEKKLKLLKRRSSEIN